MIHELKNQMTVRVLSRDNEEGRAIAWLDYGPDVSLLWIIIMKTGEVWMIKNEDVRVCTNFSLDYPK